MATIISGKSALEELLRCKDNSLTVVGFFSKRCELSKNARPVFEKVSRNNPAVIFVNVEVDEEIVRDYDITQTPTFVIFYEDEQKGILYENENLLETRLEDEIKLYEYKFPKKMWDVFKNSPPPDDDETSSSEWIDVILKFLKLCSYLITFIVVLSCSVLSKGLVLFMTSIIKPNRTGLVVCSHGIPGLDRDKKYEVVLNLTDPERVAWIWALVGALIVPELMTLFRSARICTFKSIKRPSKSVFSLIFIIETLHTIGLVMLVFVILPSLDVTKGVILTNCFCFIPGCLSLFSRHSGEPGRGYKTLLDLLSIGAQLAGLILWSLAESSDNPVAIYIPITSLLISVGWWENYIDAKSSFRFIQNLANVKNSLQKSRYFIYIFISTWKIFVIFISTIVCRLLVDGSALYLFTQFKSAFTSPVQRVNSQV